MAITYADNTLEIAVMQTYAGRPVVNVWHMWHAPEAAGPDKVGVVRDFAANWQDHIMLLQDDQITLEGYNWRSLDPDEASVGFVGPEEGKRTTGAAVTASMPPNVAYLIKKNTPNRPRGRRDGRCYLAGVPESAAMEGGVLAANTVTENNLILADFYNGISDTATYVGGWAGDRYPVVLETTPASRLTKAENGGVEPPPVLVTTRRVTSITLDGTLATQRERLR